MRAAAASWASSASRVPAAALPGDRRGGAGRRSARCRVMSATSISLRAIDRSLPAWATRQHSCDAGLDPLVDLGQAVVQRARAGALRGPRVELAAGPARPRCTNVRHGSRSAAGSMRGAAGSRGMATATRPAHATAPMPAAAAIGQPDHDADRHARARPAGCRPAT